MKSSLSVLAMLIVASLSIIRASSGGTRTASPQEGQDVPEQARPITEKQKEHSKLYRQYGLLLNNRRLTDQLAATPGDVAVTVGHPDPALGTAAASVPLPEFLRELSCRADAVVIARPKTKSSHLTEGQEFVFTDYDMSAQEVLKNNTAEPIQVDALLTVTRPGGTIRIDRHNIKAMDVSFQPFKADRQYLLFLSYIPSTGAYKSLSSMASFQVGDVVHPLTAERLPTEAKVDDPVAFLVEVRNAIALGCK